MSNKANLMILVLLALVVLALALVSSYILINDDNDIQSGQTKPNDPAIEDPSYNLENVYISMGSGRDLYAVGTTLSDSPLIALFFNAEDYTEIYVNGDYTIELYLKGAYPYVYDNYYVINEQYATKKYQNGVEVLYKLPTDFVLPEVNSWNLVGSYQYYALLKIKDNNTEIVYTSNLLNDNNFTCAISQSATSGYLIYDINVELNSDSFDSSGVLVPTIDLTTDCDFSLVARVPNTANTNYRLVLLVPENLFDTFYNGDYEINLKITLESAAYSTVTQNSWVTPLYDTSISYANGYKGYSYRLPSNFEYPQYLDDKGMYDTYYYSARVTIKNLVTNKSIDIYCDEQLECVYNSSFGYMLSGLMITNN